MTLMNKIIRRIPKKQVDIATLEKPGKSQSARMKGTFGTDEPATVKKAILNHENSSSRVEPSNKEEELETAEYEILEREIVPEKIICPDCGGITLEGLEYCDKCGGELNATR